MVRVLGGVVERMKTKCGGDLEAWHGQSEGQSVSYIVYIQ